MNELAITLTDAALSMFQSLVGRANLRAKKRLEETIAASAEQGRVRLLRIAEVLEAVVTAVRSEADVTAAIIAIAPLETVADDAATIRRTLRPGRPDVLGELALEYHVFRKIGARFLSNFAFEGGRAVQPLLAAIAVLRGIGGDRRKPLPADVPLGHLERRRPFDEKIISKLSPLGWDHINITGDYVWSNTLEVDQDGFLPIRLAPS